MIFQMNASTSLKTSSPTSRAKAASILKSVEPNRFQSLKKTSQCKAVTEAMVATADRVVTAVIVVTAGREAMAAAMVAAMAAKIRAVTADMAILATTGTATTVTSSSSHLTKADPVTLDPGADPREAQVTIGQYSLATSVST